jgi:curved DNA-binding protein CbpA
VIPIPPSWIALGIVTVAAGLYVAHCEHVKSERDKADAVASLQERQNALQALRDLKAKERADEDYERRISRLRADVKRLRESSASQLPSSAPGPSGAPTATFDRSELDAALRSYRDEVARGRAEIRGIVGEGAEAVEGLDTAKIWAQGL